MDNLLHVKVQISDSEKNSARRLARSMGMTFQGWLGYLIRKELIASSPSAISLNTPTEGDGAFNDTHYGGIAQS